MNANLAKQHLPIDATIFSELSSLKTVALVKKSHETMQYDLGM